MLTYAVKLTQTPAAITEADIQALREHNFDDTAIHDIAHITALFNYYNRLADGLGIDLEPGMPPYHKTHLPESPSMPSQLDKESQGRDNSPHARKPLVS